MMDGGSGLNIMYAKTLNVMGVDRMHLHPTRAPFHGIVPRKQAMPLRADRSACYLWGLVQLQD